MWNIGCFGFCPRALTNGGLWNTAGWHYRRTARPVWLYFENTGIRQMRRNNRRSTPPFSPEVWSAYSRVMLDLPKTNNVIKACHRAFQGTVGYIHPTIYKLVDAIRLEQSHTENVECRPSCYSWKCKVCALWRFPENPDARLSEQGHGKTQWYRLKTQSLGSSRWHRSPHLLIVGLLSCYFCSYKKIRHIRKFSIVLVLGKIEVIITSCIPHFHILQYFISCINCWFTQTLKQS